MAQSAAKPSQAQHPSSRPVPEHPVASASGEVPARDPITIKKYANRRLYNTATSSYVTLDNLCQMVKAGSEFLVFDAKTGEDITRSVLTQIIVEEESKGQNLLPISFLRQLISLYGDNMQWLVPSYLENSMQTFSRNQEQMRTYLQEAFGGLFPFGPFEQMGKQNIAMIERAMKMFVPAPGTGTGPGMAAPSSPTAPSTGSQAAGHVAPPIDEMRRQLEEMQKQLDRFTALAAQTRT
jgi:polyhydroxyalkanoate synthesis repressor PhaR